MRPPRATRSNWPPTPPSWPGVRGRYSAFFRSLAGTADGCWALEDVDLAVLTIPTIASRTDADAAVRLVLEDLGHFATRRKARVGDDVLLVLDEFSAVQGGTDQAIHLAERLRDVGVPVIFGAQSPEGLGMSASSGGCCTPSVGD